MTNAIHSEDILVSVVMITYKHEKYIAQAIKSILDQETTFNYELIVAEDCSPDNTRSVVEDYIKNHPKGNLVNYFRHEKNIGMQANANFAFEQCKGKYIATCEGDDYWTDSRKLQQQISFLEANPGFRVCFTDTVYVDSTGKKTGESNYSLPDETSFEDLAQRMFIHTPSAAFINGDISASDLKKFEKYPYTDLPTFLLASIRGKIKRIPGYMTAYRQNVGMMHGWNQRDGWLKKLSVLTFFRNDFSLTGNQKRAIDISRAWLHLKLAKNLALAKNGSWLKHYVLFLYYSLSKILFKGRIIENVEIADYIRPLKYFFLKR